MARIAGIIGVVLLAACGSTKTMRVDPASDDAIMGTGLESGDVEALSALSGDLMSCPALTGPNVQGVPTVAIYPVQNDTDVDFDGGNLVLRIESDLVNKAYGRVQFVVRNERDLALLERERKEKRSGEYTSSKQVTKTGADFYLTGVAKSVSKTGKGMESRTIWIYFQLEDAETAAVVWMKKYVTKKVGEAGILYR